LIENRKRWLAFYLLCAGEFMIVIDTTIVNVALPSIQTDLAFSETALVWVVNAYMVTYGGFLLLGGRLGDYYGQRRLLLLGTALFTAASLVCGLSATQALLVVARAVQGLGGAMVSAIALSLIMNLFTGAADRAKAMGIYGFICAGGGSVGVLAGGLLTSTLSWHWVFLVNLPIGALVCAFCFTLLAPDRVPERAGRLDAWGAITVTAASTLAVYAIVNGNHSLLAVAAVLFAVFLAIEARVSHPLMPLRLFRVRSLAVSNVVGVLWAAAMFAWFFISALYMQLVLGYDPMQIGLAFLPANLIMAAFSIGLSAKLVMRYGIRAPIIAGMLLSAAGLALFALAPVGGSFLVHILPGMLLLGLGCGMALNPVMLAAMSDVAPSDSGLASGVVNTSFMMGGSLGLAVLASLAAARTEALATTLSQADALAGGYRIAFAVATVFAAAAAAFAAALPRASAAAAQTEPARAWRLSRVASKDGTPIAFERSGSGPALILVDGALCYRAFGPAPQLAALLEQHFTVFTYDRRGRGESGDTAPYAVEREVEDIEALVREAGGAAYVYGISSGAALALEAANRIGGIRKLALYEAPFIVDGARPPVVSEWTWIDQALAADRRADALKHFMKLVGMPGFLIFLMWLMPAWSKLEAVAHTLAYDGALMRDHQLGEPLPAGRWAAVTIPTLAVAGGKSPAWMRNAMQAVAKILPHARHRTLEGQNHMVKPKALAPVLVEFFQ
jgi:EmrB/QacA subfamily drug resistance transporter